MHNEHIMLIVCWLYIVGNNSITLIDGKSKSKSISFRSSQFYEGFLPSVTVAHVYLF